MVVGVEAVVVLTVVGVVGVVIVGGGSVVTKGQSESLKVFSCNLGPSRGGWIVE